MGTATHQKCCILANGPIVYRGGALTGKIAGRPPGGNRSHRGSGTTLVMRKAADLDRAGKYIYFPADPVMLAAKWTDIGSNGQYVA